MILTTVFGGLKWKGDRFLGTELFFLSAVSKFPRSSIYISSEKSHSIESNQLYSMIHNDPSMKAQYQSETIDEAIARLTMENALLRAEIFYLKQSSPQINS